MMPWSGVISGQAIDNLPDGASILQEVFWSNLFPWTVIQGITQLLR